MCPICTPSLFLSCSSGSPVHFALPPHVSLPLPHAALPLCPVLPFSSCCILLNPSYPLPESVDTCLLSARSFLQLPLISALFKKNLRDPLAAALNERVDIPVLPESMEEWFLEKVLYCAPRNTHLGRRKYGRKPINRGTGSSSSCCRQAGREAQTEGMAWCGQ